MTDDALRATPLDEVMRINRGIHAISGRIDATAGGIHAISGRIDAIADGIHTISDRIDATAGGFHAISGRIHPTFVREIRTAKYRKGDTF